MDPEGEVPEIKNNLSVVSKELERFLKFWLQDDDQDVGLTQGVISRDTTHD